MDGYGETSEGIRYPLAEPTPTRTYRVVSDRVVAGHSKGEEFDFAFTAAQELSLIEAGHIEVAEKPAVPVVRKAKPNAK